MADVKVTKQTTTKPNTVTKYTWTPVAAGSNAVIDSDYKDERTIILVKTTTAGNITIKHGNGYGGVNDMTKAIAAGEEYAFTLDSTIFKNVSGDYKGKIVIESDGTSAFYIAVIEARV